jgi:hypothetical protein
MIYGIISPTWSPTGRVGDSGGLDTSSATSGYTIPANIDMGGGRYCWPGASYIITSDVIT